MTPFHAAFYNAHLFGQNTFWSISNFFGTFSLFPGSMDVQLFARFDQLNALAGKRTQECTLCHGASAGSVGTRYRPAETEMSQSVHFGLSDLGGHFEITQKSGSPLKMAKNRTAA